VPKDSGKRNTALIKFAGLNGQRTNGKYYVNEQNRKIQFSYFKSVTGGMCFSDFEQTVRLIEYVVLNDLKILKKLAS